MFQKTTIIGNVGRDPELKTYNNKSMLQLNVATSRYVNQKEETTWFRVTCWEKMAESLNQRVKKGTRLFVEGRFVSDANTGGPRIFTRNDGTPGANFEIVAETVRVLAGGVEKAKDNSGTPEDVEIPW